MNAISQLRIVWQNAYTQDILFQGLPIPRQNIFSMDAAELEHSVRRALRLGAFWLSRDARPREYIEFQAAHGVAVGKVCFLPGHGDRYLVTVSQGIWSLISVWDITQMRESGDHTACATYSPKRMLLSGLVVNSDPTSEGTLAIAALENMLVHFELLMHFCTDLWSLASKGLLYCPFAMIRQVHLNCVRFARSTPRTSL